MLPHPVYECGCFFKRQVKKIVYVLYAAVRLIQFKNYFVKKIYIGIQIAIKNSLFNKKITNGKALYETLKH